MSCCLVGPDCGPCVSPMGPLTGYIIVFQAISHLNLRQHLHTKRVYER